MSAKPLLNDLIKFRDNCIADRDSAATRFGCFSECDYDTQNGRELALDEVIYNLNKLIQEHS